MYLQPEGQRRLHGLRISGWAGVVTFSILIALQLEEVYETYWLVLSIPLLISIFSVPLAIHTCFTYITKEIRPTSRRLILLSIYLMSLAISSFVILAACLMDDILDISWAIAFIPIWLAHLIYLIFCIFLCPGLVDPKVNMRRQAFLMFNYLCGLVALNILLVCHLDNDAPEDWHMVFLPVWICTGLHLLSLILDSSTRTSFTSEHFIIIFLVVETILIVIRNEFDDDMPASVAMIPLFVMLLSWIVMEEKYHRDYEDKGL
jgi:hypothetical protein